MTSANRRDRYVLAAIVAGTSVVLVLAWVLWTLSGDPTLDGERGGGRVVTWSGGGGGASPDLPVAREERGGARPATRPRELATEEPAPQGPEGVLGLVVDAADGAPIPVFQVHVLEADQADPLDRLDDTVSRPFHVRTGVFLVEQPEGVWDVVVQAPGYEPGVLRAVRTPAPDRAPHRVELRRGPGIVGLVVDGRLAPVEGVPVFLEVVELFSPEASPPRIRTAKTGADGRFSFSPLPDGEYAVALLEPTNRVDRQAGLRVAGDTLTTEIVLTPRHELTVNVQGEDGLPVEGALVEVRSREAHFARGRSNDRGMVLLEHLPDGQYTLTATPRRGPAVREEFELYGGTGQQVRWVTVTERP